MTEPDDVWAEVARRAAVSRFSGVTADDDDVMADVQLREAQLNPNRQGGQNGVGGPGMMPPMMMGGMGAGGAGAAGGGGGGGGGLGGGAAAAAAASTKPAQASTGVGVQAAEAPVAEDVVEEPEVPGLGGGLGGGGIGGGGLGGGGGGLPEGAGAGGAVGPADGFSADPVAVRGIASKWAELAQEIHALESPIFDAALGLVLPPERPQQAVNEQVRNWTTGAGEEFDALVGRLHDVAGQYEAVEETGAAEIRKKTADE